MADDLRAEIAQTLRDKAWVRKMMGDGCYSLLQADEHDLADAVLALPAVQEALAAAEAVKRVEALHVPDKRDLFCASCGDFYPCRTLLALAGEDR